MKETRPAIPGGRYGGLLKVDSLGSSLGIYVPAMVVQKALGFGRILIMVYLLADLRQEYGLWGLGLMILSMLAPLLTMGANHGLVRYVSFYEARGRLGEFYRSTRAATLGIVLALGAAALALSPLIAQVALAFKPEAAAAVSGQRQLDITRLAVANAIVLAAYYNLLGFCYGLRVYRVVSLLEVLFNAAFAVAAPLVVLAWPSAEALLTAHLACLAATLVLAWALLESAVRRVAASHAPPAGDDLAAAAHPLRKVLRFGWLAMLGSLAWLLVGYVSFYMVSHYRGPADAAVLGVMTQLAQPVAFIGAAAWAVLYSYVARQWESGRRRAAMQTLEASFKVISLALLTLTVLLSITAPLWVRVLPSQYHGGVELAASLLLAAQAATHLALATMVGQLHERPSVAVVVALAGAGLNALLAAAWLPSEGIAGAAWAAGVGLYAGGGAVAMVYLLASRSALSGGTYVVLASPGILLLPPAWALSALAVLLVVSIFTGAIITARQRRRAVAALRRLLARRGG